MTTKQTIIRHLKGIVAALEKENEPQQLRYRGVLIPECTDEDLIKALNHLVNTENGHFIQNYFLTVQQIEKELDRRSIVAQ